MAVELKDSREQHYTMDGQAVTVKLMATHAEANALKSYGLPIVGTKWSNSRPDLIVTDIRIVSVPDNTTHAYIIYTYSVVGKNWPQRIPETVASVNQVFDFQITPSTSDEYWDYTAGDAGIRSWKKVWSDAGGDADNVPPRVREDATIVMTITGNVHRWSWPIVSSALGRVNSNTFLQTYVDRYVVDPAGNDVAVEAIQYNEGHNDAGQWLFAGFRAESIGRAPGVVNQPNYQIAETFIWEADGWNSVYGVTGYKAYQTASFFQLPRPYAHNVSIDTRTY